jgi:hypothetical protein
MVHINDQPVNDLPFNPFGGGKIQESVVSMAPGPSQHLLLINGSVSSTSRVTILSMHESLIDELRSKQVRQLNSKIDWNYP